MQKKTVAQYAYILYALTRDIAQADIDKAISVFHEYLRKEHASHLLKTIVQTFQARAEEWSKGPIAVITTAHDVSNDELQSIVRLLAADMNYTHVKDSSLLGGFTAQTKTLHIDASLKQSLQKLHTHLVS